MATVVVVGSGASGVHFALSLLRKKHQVTLLDVGYEGPRAPLPEAGAGDLKDELDDPVEYFLGRDYRSVLLPGSRGEFYGLPPSKDFVLRAPRGFESTARGLAPLFSFARGGLAEAWTAGCYPFDDRDLVPFPFSYKELEPHYEEVARRIGITGCADDLTRFFPVHAHLQPPLEMDEHSRALLDRYEKKRAGLNRGLGVYVGRTRVASLSRDLGSRRACGYLGRCLWGCPTDSLYTPALTLRECRSHPGFSYRAGFRVKHFTVDSARRVRTVVAESVESGEEIALDADYLALAAGTLGSAGILLRSVFEQTGEVVELPGLMDNLQVLVPFVNLGMLGRQFRTESYQYHLLGLGLEPRDAAGFVHGQITTLKTGMVHPIMQNLPIDMRTANYVTRNLRAALGICNVNFSDTRRPGNLVTLDRSTGDREPRLRIEYSSMPVEPSVISATLRRVKKALRRLGCVVPPWMVHVRPMGASVHYAGTLPMSSQPAPWTTDETCHSRDFENLFVLDGSTFPALPAKQITFTLMANAVRVADAAF